MLKSPTKYRYEKLKEQYLIKSLFKWTKKDVDDFVKSLKRIR